MGVTSTCFMKFSFWNEYLEFLLSKDISPLFFSHSYGHNNLHEGKIGTRMVMLQCEKNKIHPGKCKASKD